MSQRVPTARRHGGIHDEDLAGTGFSIADVLDFSTNVNPLGPPPGVREAVAGVDLARYPDPACTALRAELADQLGVNPDRILAGNGSTELIHLVVRLFVHQGQRPVVFAPTFSEFERAVETEGGHAYPWTATAERSFRWALRNKPGVLDRVRPPLVYLCNPNNPTGVYLRRDQIESLAASLTGGPLLLDEAYVPFVADAWSSLDLTESGRVIVLRSMTKDYAIAGLRLGYLVAHPDVVRAASALQAHWSVSSAAQAAGIAALRARGYIDETLRVVSESKQYLAEALVSLGLAVTPGSANFVLVRVGDGSDVRRRLLRQGIAVRDCASFGLPEFIRIGVRLMPDCRRLIAAIASLELSEAAGHP
jgi:histidinol-phosphate aminotransferase